MERVVRSQIPDGTEIEEGWICESPEVHVVR